MRDERERNATLAAEPGADLVAALGAVTRLTEGDPLPTKKEQVFITDHWDAG